MKTNRLISIAAVAIFALIGTVGKSQTTATQPTADDMEAELLSHITDPGQRAEIEELLN